MYIWIGSFQVCETQIISNLFREHVKRYFSLEKSYSPRVLPFGNVVFFWDIYCCFYYI